MSAHPVSRRAVLGAALGAFTTAAAGCQQTPDALTAGARPGEPIVLGLLTDRSRRLRGEGYRFMDGVRNGVLWATSRTRDIGDRTVVVDWVDDAGDPAQAATAAEDLVSRGCRMLLGGSTSDAALRIADVATRRRVVYIAGTPTADALTGLGRYVFRSGHQDSQDLLAARAVIGPGRRTVVLATGDVTTATGILGATAVVAPVTTTDFAPVIARIRAMRPEVLYVWWPQPATALWRALDRAGLLTGLEVVTKLGPRATWPGYGVDVASLRLVTSYLDGASDNNAYQALRVAVPGRRTDSGHIEGFLAAQMAVRALQFGPEDTDRMIGALESYRAGSVKGDLWVRASDHALLQSMYQVRMTWTGAAGALTGVKTRELLPEDTAPPVR